MRKTVLEAVERYPGVELLLQEKRRIAVETMKDIDAFAARRAEGRIAQDDASCRADES